MFKKKLNYVILFLFCHWRNFWHLGLIDIHHNYAFSLCIFQNYKIVYEYIYT